MTDYEKQIAAVKERILKNILPKEDYEAFLVKRDFELGIRNEWLVDGIWRGERKGPFVLVPGYRQ